MQESDRVAEFAPGHFQFAAGDAEFRRCNSRADFGGDANRRRRDSRGAFAAGRAASQPGVKQRQVPLLQLSRPLDCDALIQVLAGAAKRLSQMLRLGAKPIAAGAGNRGNQSLVKTVAQTGYLRHQSAQRSRGIVHVGASPAQRRGHQHRSRQNGRGFEQPLVAVGAGGLVDSSEHGLERALPSNKPAMAAERIQVMRIPFTEYMIGTPVGGMVVIVRPRIERELIQQCQFELSILEKIALGRGENR